jgi:hypothetical protein
MEALRDQKYKGKRVIEGRYWNCGGTGIAVVAVITGGVDWAAYIGADQSYKEMDTAEHTINWGCKLSVQDARYYFPNMELPYRG